MKSRLIVPLLLGALTVSLPALATGLASPPGTGPSYPHERLANMMPGEVCNDLGAQFDESIKSREKWALASRAMKLRDQARQLCAGGKQDDGVTKLKTALHDIGVRPRS